MTKDEQFFFDHAGYSYDPKTETKEQGRIRTAQQLAEAEATAYDLGWEFQWADDWLVGSHVTEYGPVLCAYKHEPATCESCSVYDPTSNRVLATLGCIDDADNDYRRVVEAELAVEALHDYHQKGE